MAVEIYHEKIKLPLYHVHYDVMVSSSMKQMVEHVNVLFPGLGMKVPETALGYSAVILHASGNTMMVLINTSTRKAEEPSVTRTIVHESTHLSWNIMEALGLKVSEDDNEVQAYLMEEIVDRIYSAVKDAKIPLSEDDGGNISDL